MAGDKESVALGHRRPMSDPQPDDRVLLDRWSTSRDEASFRMICDRHAGLVRGACVRLGSPDPDEAAQAVFMILARSPGRVGSADRLAGWMVITVPPCGGQSATGAR